MNASYLAAAIALAMITGVALGQSPSLTTVSPFSSASVASERNTDPGNDAIGKFWTPAEVQWPASIDDVPKTVRFAPPVSETALR
jgi:hypothetical protein